MHQKRPVGRLAAVGLVFESAAHEAGGFGGIVGPAAVHEGAVDAAVGEQKIGLRDPGRPVGSTPNQAVIYHNIFGGLAIAGPVRHQALARVIHQAAVVEAHILHEATFGLQVYPRAGVRKQRPAQRRYDNPAGVAKIAVGSHPQAISTRHRQALAAVVAAGQVFEHNVFGQRVAQALGQVVEHLDAIAAEVVQREPPQRDTARVISRIYHRH